MLYHARPLQPRRLGARQVADQQLRQRQARTLHHRPGSTKALPRPSLLRSPTNHPFHQVDSGQAGLPIHPAHHAR